MADREPVDVARRSSGGSFDQGVVTMGRGVRFRYSRRGSRKGTWVPDCEDQFQTLRALSGAAPSGKAHHSEEIDPEFEDWLEAFPMD